ADPRRVGEPDRRHGHHRPVPGRIPPAAASGRRPGALTSSQVRSHDRSPSAKDGPAMTQQKWTAADLPAMPGRTVVLTAAPSGLGLAPARELAAAGARVILAVRDQAKGHKAAAAMPGPTEVRPLDLSSLASVRAFAAAWTGPLDILINNAGIMQVPRARTSDGFELQIATNHLGPFTLTALLLPHITGRVVTVSSEMHKRGRIDPEDLCGENRPYDPFQTYCDTKLANLLFAFELQRRLTAPEAAYTPWRRIPASARRAWPATSPASAASARRFSFPC